MKFIYRFIIYILLSPIVFFSLIMVHEFSHVIVIILTGNEWTGIVFNLAKMDIAVEIIYNNIEAIPIIRVAGSTGSILICLIVVCISIKFKNLYFSFFSSCKIVAEFVYWGISPIIEFGDAYNMYKFLEFENWQILSIFFFVIAGLLFISNNIIYYKMFLKKYDIYLEKKN